MRMYKLSKRSLSKHFKEMYVKLESIIVIFTCLLGFSFTVSNETNWAEIEWTDQLEGNFDFKNEWSYPEGVYRNRFGQLSCDGICPSEIDRMKDDNGSIYPDSLKAFYAVIDTTHLFHSIKSEAWTYEWADTDFMTFQQQTDHTIIGQTAWNIATHSILNIKIKDHAVTAWIEYNSIRDLGVHTFPMKQGMIKIDPQFFAQGIIKAEFDMTFHNTLDATQKMYWKGLIYSRLYDD